MEVAMALAPELVPVRAPIRSELVLLVPLALVLLVLVRKVSAQRVPVLVAQVVPTDWRRLDVVPMNCAKEKQELALPTVPTDLQEEQGFPVSAAEPRPSRDRAVAPFESRRQVASLSRRYP